MDRKISWAKRSVIEGDNENPRDRLLKIVSKAKVQLTSLFKTNKKDRDAEITCIL